VSDVLEESMSAVLFQAGPSVCEQHLQHRARRTACATSQP
jgi:hypothetical protein